MFDSMIGSANARLVPLISVYYSLIIYKVILPSRSSEHSVRNNIGGINPTKTMITPSVSLKPKTMGAHTGAE